MFEKPLLYYLLHVVLAVLLLAAGALLYLLYAVGMDDDRAARNAAERPKDILEAERQAVQPPSFPKAPEPSKRQLAETPNTAFAPREPKKPGEATMDITPMTPPPTLTEEDEAVLTLMQEVEPPVPLGPEFEELTPPDDDTQQMITLHKALYGLPGAVVAQGQNPEPIGPMHIENYLVEEIALPQATPVEIAGQETMAHTAWRITITGGPFPVGALPVVVWADGRRLGFGQPSSDLSTLFAVTFDRALLHEGATIAVSYGESGARAEFAEELKLGVQQ